MPWLDAIPVGEYFEFDRKRHVSDLISLVKHDKRSTLGLTVVRDDQGSLASAEATREGPAQLTKQLPSVSATGDGHHAAD